MRVWSEKEAKDKAEDLKEMWTTYGEYADAYLQKKVGDPDLVIWDFTDKEMKAILKWCLRRGQTNAAVAFVLDRAMEGRTDIDFAVILGGKTLETGFRLGVKRMRVR